MRTSLIVAGDPALEHAMLIILGLYIVALWAIFSKFKLVRWGWASGSVAVLVGLLILATFPALFNYLTPSGKLTVTEISGVNTTVAQIQAQLENADRELSQTTVRAPADGYMTLVTVSVGDRALQAQSAMSFIVESEITLVGLFSQNGFQTVKDGAPVDIVFDNLPGRIYHARVIAIPKGIGQGQVAVSGTLAKTSALGGATVFPAVISIPDDMSRDSLRLGMSGSATAFSPKAGVIGLLASILVWVSPYTAYL
jgi:hypothetical protein